MWIERDRRYPIGYIYTWCSLQDFSRLPLLIYAGVFDCQYAIESINAWNERGERVQLESGENYGYAWLVATCEAMKRNNSLQLYS